MDWIEGQLDDEAIFPQKIGLFHLPKNQQFIFLSNVYALSLLTFPASCSFVQNMWPYITCSQKIKPFCIEAASFWDCKFVNLYRWIVFLIYHVWFGTAGAPFPVNFRDVVKTIFKRLFRVYAHIYHSHFQKIVSLKEEAHLNTCFKHFILFIHVLHVRLFHFLRLMHY